MSYVGDTGQISAVLRSDADIRSLTYPNGTTTRFTAPGSETAGQFGLFEALMPHGAAPPLHSHPQDETIYVLEGELTAWLVEPDRAACLFESNRAGHAVKIAPSDPTVMAMLECYEPSLLAWDILSRVADVYMTVRDTDAIEAMKQLARPGGHDPVVVAGESGAAGLAGLSVAASSSAWREMIGLDAHARVLLFNTEGATAPDIYQSLTGIDPAELMPA